MLKSNFDLTTAPYIGLDDRSSHKVSLNYEVAIRICASRLRSKAIKLIDYFWRWRCPD